MENGGAHSCLATMAQVVGWKEEPELFSRALESYREAEGLRFLLVGVDGDSAEDMEMLDVFHKVSHPQNVEASFSSRRRRTRKTR
jgi:hyaluronan synthase